MAQIKLITKDTIIENLEMTKFPWDVQLYGTPYQVVKIEGYVHSIGGRWGENDLWMYPRNCDPSYQNLIEYQGDGSGVCWGIKYEPKNYMRHKYGECECYTTGGAMITRNGEDFYFCRNGISEAQYMLTQIHDHPLDLNTYGFVEKMIGRKVWWRSEPAIIRSWIGGGQACVMLEPDGIDNFTTPAEFVGDDIMDHEDRDVKADIFDKHIWWFRE